jgi:hypothetical protein
MKYFYADKRKEKELLQNNCKPYIEYVMIINSLNVLMVSKAKSIIINDYT